MNDWILSPSHLHDDVKKSMLSFDRVVFLVRCHPTWIQETRQMWIAHVYEIIERLVCICTSHLGLVSVSTYVSEIPEWSAISIVVVIIWKSSFSNLPRVHALNVIKAWRAASKPLRIIQTKPAVATCLSISWKTFKGPVSDILAAAILAIPTNGTHSPLPPQSTPTLTIPIDVCNAIPGTSITIPPPLALLLTVASCPTGETCSLVNGTLSELLEELPIDQQLLDDIFNTIFDAALPDGLGVSDDLYVITICSYFTHNICFKGLPLGNHLCLTQELCIGNVAGVWYPFLSEGFRL